MPKNLTQSDLVVGQSYRVTKRLHGHGFEIGEVITFKTRPDGFSNDTKTWYLGAEEVEEVELEQEEDSVPSRPTIDFSGSGGLTGTDRSTARAYAADLISRVNKGTTNAVLDQVASGSKEVDAYALAAAVLDATRGSLTRFGQSTARRRAGEKAAHLGYIAHSVLANHADALPAYADGERSRKIETLEGEIAALKVAGAHGIEVNQSLAADLTKAREEARALRREVESLNRSVTHIQTQRIHNAKVLDYAKSLLTDANRTKVEGFVSGLSAGRNTNWDV